MVPYIARKIENDHVVWFEKSNQWVLFEEPKWFIFDLFNKGIERDNAIKDFAQKYGIGRPESSIIVSNIYDSVTKLFNPDFALPNFTSQSEQVRKYDLKDKRTHSYSFNQKGFSISYGSQGLREYFHKALQHLEIKESSNFEIEAEIFPFNQLYALRFNGGECFSAQESSQIKRLLYIKLASLFYGINAGQWLTLLHASAVKAGEHSIVMASPSGSGKSYMAHLLCAEGCEFISDDFIPVDAINKFAYPFPAAICLKGESPPEQQYIQLKHQQHRSKLRYIYPPKASDPKGGKIDAIVFIRYIPLYKNEIAPLSTINALKLFLGEAWVTNNSHYIPEFLDWFAGLRFFELNYGDERAAVSTLLEITQKK